MMFTQSPVLDSLTTTMASNNISSRISGNSEAGASELLEILEEMFPRYSMHNNGYSMLNLKA